METKALRVSLAAILLTAASICAGAFTMAPMTALLAPSGAGSIATFRIDNPSSERVAIRFRILSRASSPEGTEINAPADSLFVVYPARLLVEGGAMATVKVQWLGKEKIQSERSFRLVAEQVALDASASKDGGSGIKIMFRYIASLYVGESGFTPLLVAEARGAVGANGRSGYLVEIRNEGARHVIDSEAKVTLSEGPTFSSDELSGISGANFLPGDKRTLFIPSPEAVDGKSYEARIDYEGVY